MKSSSRPATNAKVKMAKVKLMDRIVRATNIGKFVGRRWAANKMAKTWIDFR